MNYSRSDASPFPTETGHRPRSDQPWTAKRVSRPISRQPIARITRRFEVECCALTAAESEVLEALLSGVSLGQAIGALAERGMSLIGRNATLRRPFALRALGLEGELPRFARRLA